MYLEYWNLRGKPFTTSFRAALLYMRPAFARALRSVSVTARLNHGTLWLLGPRGSGKTTLVRTLAGDLRDEVRVKIISMAQVSDPEEFLTSLRPTALQGSAIPRGGARDCVRANFLEGPASDLPLLLVLEDADNISTPALIDECKVILGLERGRLWPLTTLLTGQAIPVELQQSPERRFNTISLSPPTPEECRMLIEHRLSRAGASLGIFTPEALKAIIAASGGHIGRLLVICDICLQIGSEDGARRIELDLVRTKAYPLLDDAFAGRLGDAEASRAGAADERAAPRTEPADAGVGLRNLDEFLENVEPSEGGGRVYPNARRRMEGETEGKDAAGEGAAAEETESTIPEQEPAAFYKAGEELLDGVLSLLRRREFADLSDLKSHAANLVASTEKSSALLHLAIGVAGDSYSLCTHLLNVAVLAVCSGRTAGFSNPNLAVLAEIALLHDVGHLHCGEDLLSSEHRFDRRDFRVIKQHPQIGYELIANLTNGSDLMAEVIRMEHERDDGLGYPNYLSGEKIHIFAKVICVCDVFEALTHPRAHRRTLTPAEGLVELNATLLRRTDPRFIKALTLTVHKALKEREIA